MTVDDALRLHSIGDKMSMATKRRMVDDEADTEESRDSLIKRVRDAVKGQDWEGAAASLSVLWFQDWRHHLGRDFTAEGSEPEHAGAALALCGEEPEHAVATTPRRATSPGGNVVKFPGPAN